MRKVLTGFRQNLIFALLMLAFSFPAAAASLAEYRENIVHLKDDVELIVSPDEDSTEGKNLAFEKEVLAEFPKLLPAQDRIEWENSTFEINNQWIYDALDRLDKESPKSTKRDAIFIEIGERLSAIEKKLDELEQVAAATGTKDEDKRKLAEILRREEYQKPEKSDDSFIKNLYRRIVEWLAEMFPRPNLPNADSSGFQSFSFVLQILLYAVILGAIAFVVYRFAPFFINKYRLKEKRTKKDRVILGERLAEGATAQTLFSEAENLARQGNLRGAIRKGYIALLCELSDKKIIGLSQHKTNRDYLRDVRKQNSLYQNMSGLTDNYERHWYGFENADERDWEEFRSGYKQAIGSQ